MKTIIALLAIVTVGLGLSGCRSSDAATPTPPPLKPKVLTWDDPNAADVGVLYFNIYTKDKLTGLYSYLGTVYKPAPNSYTIAAGTALGTIFTATASDGSAESAKADPGAVLTGPLAPINTRISTAP